MLGGAYLTIATSGFMTAASTRARTIVLDWGSGGAWSGLTEGHFVNSLPTWLVFSIFLSQNLTACRANGCVRVGV